jgi:hypothetical protein
MFRLNFTERVLGEEAAEKLRQKKVTQTLRSPKSDIVGALLGGRLRIGDLMEIALEGKLLGLAYPAAVDRVTWVNIDPSDAVRGGFENLDGLQQALQRAGDRFQPIVKYQLYRIQFTWMKEGKQRRSL